MNPAMDLLVESHGTSIKCAVCGFENVHQLGVEVFERKEDAEHGLHVVVGGQESGLGTKQTRSWLFADSDVVSSNPSTRRQGLRIPFYCESCGGEHDAGPHFSWLISQHKGWTYIETETHI